MYSWHIYIVDGSMTSRTDSNCIHERRECLLSSEWPLEFCFSLPLFGKETYIRYGKSNGGLVGKSLSAEQVSDLTLSITGQYVQKNHFVTSSTDDPHPTKSMPIITH